MAVKTRSKAQPKKGAVHVKVKKGDMVVFVAGKDYNRYDANGKRTPYRGRIIQVDPRNARVKVEGAGIIKKHTRANPQLNVQGGIMEKESWIDISNVAVVDPETGVPTRIRYQTKDDGKKVRVAVKSGKVIE